METFTINETNESLSTHGESWVDDRRLVRCCRCGVLPKLEFKNWGKGHGKVDRLNIRLLHFCEGVTMDFSHSENSNDHEKFLEPIISSWAAMNAANAEVSNRRQQT